MHSFPRHIFLVGFSGSGKSTIGPRLAKRMKRPFIDIDDMITRRMTMTVPELFRKYGEQRFRREEEACLKLAAARPPSVVAVGGGAFQSPSNRKLMQEHGTTVYLSCARREIYRRLKNKTDRPLLSQPTRAAQVARIRELLDRRVKHYRRADLTVATTTRSVAQSVDQIIRKLEALHG